MDFMLEMTHCLALASQFFSFYCLLALISVKQLLTNCDIIQMKVLGKTQQVSSSAVAIQGRQRVRCEIKSPYIWEEVSLTTGLSHEKVDYYLQDTSIGLAFSADKVQDMGQEAGAPFLTPNMSGDA